MHWDGDMVFLCHTWDGWQCWGWSVSPRKHFHHAWGWLTAVTVGDNQFPKINQAVSCIGLFDSGLRWPVSSRTQSGVLHGGNGSGLGMIDFPKKLSCVMRLADWQLLVMISSSKKTRLCPARGWLTMVRAYRFLQKNLALPCIGMVDIDWDNQFLLRKLDCVMQREGWQWLGMVSLFKETGCLMQENG